jgi:DNA-binding NarL/FixJ family response regulator
MTRIYVADARPEERSALRLLFLDLDIDVVGEGVDWATTIAEAPGLELDILLIDWDLLPDDPTEAIKALRNACPAALLIVLISHHNARQQAAMSAGADTFISKGETPQRIAERLKFVVDEMKNKKTI